jgi:hypothetical protein
MLSSPITVVRITGVVGKEEVRHGEYADAWLFATKITPRAMTPSETHVVR